MTQFFGLYALTGKVTSFIGPLAVGAADGAIWQPADRHFDPDPVLRRRRDRGRGGQADARLRAERPMASPPRDDLVRPIYNAAMAHAQRGAHDQAIRVLTAGGNAALLHPATRNLLGNLYLMQGKTAEALRAFDAVVEAEPGLRRGALQQERRAPPARAERRSARGRGEGHRRPSRLFARPPDPGAGAPRSRPPEDQLAALDVAERLGADKAEIEESRIDALFDLCRSTRPIRSWTASSRRDGTARTFATIAASSFSIAGGSPKAGKHMRGGSSAKASGRGASIARRRAGKARIFAARSSLIYGEQGLGDAIHFARYLHAHTERCRRDAAREEAAAPAPCRRSPTA